MSRRTFLGALALTAGTSALLAASDPVPHLGGYASVTAMLAADPFYIAHHGCSRTWPEMSLYAYAQSVRRGFGALELSLARTIDGVWFGLHDATLDRTSGVVGKTASEMTWAEVQALRILGSNAQEDPTQPSRPYMRWEEIIAAYYPSHVIFVDPKSAIAHGAELMAKMNALAGEPRRHLVCKYFGVSGGVDNASGWARLAADNGYSRWGYFYGSDRADFAAYQGRWGILGLDYSASAARWATMRGYGKPIIAHVVPNQAAVAAARSKGARGVVASSATAMLTGRR